ncbi:MAG: hypothetical protein SFV23_09205, partial [Planctomycetaceae bacterium]|nr:hypothetical protein [Planctomycetaceae bacterium]
VEPIAENVNGMTDNRGSCSPTDDLKMRLQMTTTRCVCAVFPIWDDGSNFLYYSELCSTTPSCELLDVVYYWDGPLENWPVGCNPPGNDPCGDCAPVSMTAFVNSDPKFPRNFSKARKTHSALHNLPNKVPHSRSGVFALPREAVDGSLSCLVKFNALTTDDPTGETREAYAKLFILQVDMTNDDVNAPKMDTKPFRFIYAGYEIKPEDIVAGDKVRSVTSKLGIRKLRSGDAGVDAGVQTVELDGHSYLVVLSHNE